jgi:molybdopterin-guanine dinucleotide biosynthesis protein A
VTVASGIIFAGGRATRLGGVSKALLDVGGVPLIERVLRTLSPRTNEVIAVVNDDSLDHLPVLRTILDPDPHAGVLPALRAGLAAAHDELCLVVACDMPFASGPLFDLLLSLADRYDLVLPVVAGQPEPLHAVYRREPCLAAVGAALARDQRRMIAFHGQVRVRQVAEAELRLADPDLRAFMNVNTPEDLAAALVFAARDDAQAP